MHCMLNRKNCPGWCCPLNKHGSPKVYNINNMICKFYLSLSLPAIVQNQSHVDMLAPEERRCHLLLLLHSSSEGLCEGDFVSSESLPPLGTSQDGHRVLHYRRLMHHYAVVDRQFAQSLQNLPIEEKHPIKRIFSPTHTFYIPSKYKLFTHACMYKL